ncbi:hypothetical protein RJT34_33215 [Clitoria ternatea]|uniref:Uncharacterized protein n=1 Tax=Clitoria ternatea TaxID=43366 RepID=A0AAN9F5F9_CLITE
MIKTQGKKQAQLEPYPSSRRKNCALRWQPEGAVSGSELSHLNPLPSLRLPITDHVLRAEPESKTVRPLFDLVWPRLPKAFEAWSTNTCISFMYLCPMLSDAFPIFLQ